jgi:hypothetical protein
MTRARTVIDIANHGDAYSLGEEDEIGNGLAKFYMFPSKHKVINVDMPMTKARVAYVRRGNQAWGLSTTQVRASPVECLAHHWNLQSRTSGDDDDEFKKVVMRESGHSQIYYTKRKMPYPILDRDCLMRVLWRAVGNGYVLVFTSVELAKFPITPDTVRATLPCAWKYTPINASTTKMEYVCNPNSGGSIPPIVLKMLVKRICSYPSNGQIFFQRRRSLSQYDIDDGRPVGEAIMARNARSEEFGRREGLSKVKARAICVLDDYVGMVDAERRWPWFRAMILRVVENKLR